MCDGAGVEEWRDLDDEGFCKVSNTGRINNRGRITAGSVTGRGYLTTTVCGRSALVHVLVLEAFNGPRPDGHVAAHLDGSKDNNTVENLAWVTQAENLSHMDAHGTRPRGSANGFAKVTSGDVTAIRAMVSDGASQRAACARFNLSPAAVHNIIHRKTWRHV